MFFVEFTGKSGIPEAFNMTDCMSIKIGVETNERASFITFSLYRGSRNITLEYDTKDGARKDYESLMKAIQCQKYLWKFSNTGIR